WRAASLLRPASLRGPFCRYDLLGRLAGEFRHVVELEREAADARSGGADLDDEIADLALRHHGADHVPALPTLAGVETENLTALAGQDRVDLGGGVRWARDLHHMDRLQQHRLALRQRLGYANTARNAERHVGGVDRMIRAVDQGHRDVDHRKAERAMFHRVDDAFLDSRAVIARDHATAALALEL